jgi:hypothetical protein
MLRDPVLQKQFEAIDDSLTSVLGHSHYSMATFLAVQSDDQAVLLNIPSPAMRITHEWARYFDSKQLVSVMRSIYGLVGARMGLVLVVSYFEPGLKRIMERITLLQKDLSNVPQHYKQKLKWSFDKVASSNYGSPTMQRRIPDLCSDIDHARRLRNLLMHNSGFFNQFYEDDALIVVGKSPMIHKDFAKFKENPNQQIPALISLDEFRQIAYSHIEFNHHLHDVLQREYFGCSDSYGYVKEQKTIEWHRLLLGQ